MTIQEKLYLDAVPDEDTGVVKLFRRSLRDTVEANILENIRESEDIDLYYALLTAAIEINTEMAGVFTVGDLKSVPWNILQMGALLKLLTTVGILSARNTLTYQDAGGVSIQDYDKYGRYVNYFNVLTSGYIKSLMSWKMQVNFDSCYGGVHSEYGLRTVMYDTN